MIFEKPHALAGSLYLFRNKQNKTENIFDSEITKTMMKGLIWRLRPLFCRPIPDISSN
jgi:hypothetical protein